MTKPISLKKQEILDRWDAADPDQRPPLIPIDTDHKGSTYAEDSFRVTGSQEWIDWVLARLKPLLEFDGNGCRLQPMYMQTSKRTMVDGKLVSGDLTGAWAFYFKAVSRGSGVRGGRPKGSKNKPKEGVEPKPDKEDDSLIKNLKAVNAGLKLRGKTKTEKQPEPPKENKQTYDEPLYAIARGSMESAGRDTPDWLEPTEENPPFPMKTYDDAMSLDDAIEKATKEHKLKRVTGPQLAKKNEIQKIEITMTDKGKLIFEEY